MNEREEQSIVEGRKTFFIVPDSAMLPESYLQDYLIRGYETYIINDDRYCPIRAKVDVLISTFPDSILFFFIDTDLPDVDWERYIRELQRKHDGRILIGVLYERRDNEAEKARLEKTYLFDIGIQCGCIAMEYERAKNFALIDRVMHANQAEGRRKNVRAICDSNSRINFTLKNVVIQGAILDVSVSHFSCLLPPDLPIKMYEKLKRMLVNINGMHFTTDAILLMKRDRGDKSLYIFVFTRSDGAQGLESDIEMRLVDKIYQMITGKVKDLLSVKFEEVKRQMRSQSSTFLRTYSSGQFM